ncbi:uncharacterized protein [Hoplias malabaricus]|uniref:uncharacterized protein n=1 Tax=Hoplias malabaricus TaxID=27720 RepID=UPI0034620C5B
MGATGSVIVSVKNETPYTWFYSKLNSGEFHPLGSGCKVEYEESKAERCYIYLRFQVHYSNSFSYEFSSFKDKPTFVLRESFTRDCIELHCSTESSVQQCPNYGKMDKDGVYNEQERRRQEEARRQEEMEERRRLERLEREQRFHEEIESERESLRIKQSRASERLREKQSFRSNAHRQERTQVVYQQIEDDAAEIESNEVADVEDKFKMLLSKYHITEDESMVTYKLENRIKMLQDELAIQYCREHLLPMWSQYTFDHTVGYKDLSLTEKLTVLEAVLQLTLYDDTELEMDREQALGWEKKYDFLFSLVEKLHDSSPTMAEHILLNILDSVPELSSQSRNVLGQLLYNRIWTLTEIMLFIRTSSGIEHSRINSVLYTAQTYKLSYFLTVSSLRTENPVMSLKEQVKKDKDKKADTILKELRKENCPENVMSVLEDVLKYLESELPKYLLMDLTKEQIEDGKMKIRSLNLANPDISILKEVLIGMSIAVQDCTTITSSDNKVTQGYFPRLTQMASLLLLLLAPMTSNKGCLLEIGTGEGKSCILAMFATIQAIRGTNVDIVTSSPVLARRDHEEWQKLFQMLGVTSSVVPPPSSSAQFFEHQEIMLQNAYAQQIIYGTVGNFAADTLRQEFQKRTTRGERKFELVIVDEVDFMTLDNGIQMTFLSHEAGGLRHMEQILANIWTMISTCQPVEMLETGEIKWATRIQHFHKAVTAAVMGSEMQNFSANDILLPGVCLGFFSQEDFEKCLDETEKNKSHQKAFAEIMMKIGISQQFDLLRIFEEVLENCVVFECYSVENRKARPFLTQKKQGDLKIEMLLMEGGYACEIISKKTLIDVTVKTIISSVKYSNDVQASQNMEDSKNFIVIPHFLKNYTENQLPVFVENALRAVQMTQDREYMIDSSAERDTVSTPDKHEYNAIIPVDFKASGVLEKNKKWGSGLQQFLEMKHQLAISPLSSVTNYMSNFHYFKRYLNGNGIFGVSGTLGGDIDKNFLAKHYQTKSYNIPSHRHKKVVELPAIQVKQGNIKWIQTICETAQKAAGRGQVVLVICEDVKTADELHKEMQFGGRFAEEKITMYTISERHNIEKENFCAGKIIIATNLGGRGTDIKIDPSVNECGGLFVLLTHFPRNPRVEKQIFGRTSRKGNPGMVQMVLNSEHLAPAYQGQPLEIMRQLREKYEMTRVLDMENDELAEINLKEELFSKFCEFLKDFDRHYTESERQEYLQLLRQKADIPDCFKNYQSKFDYQPALNALKESWALWMTLHEEHISRHEDSRVLQEDLLNTMNQTSENLLQGKSDNFYHHIRQAMVRTELHCRNRLDCGAKIYWKNVENCDPFYKAVACYNQAYIIINLAQDNYKTDAIKLLKAAKDSIDVHISEVSNTMVSCSLSVTDKFKDHQKESNNFQSQMAARMHIFKAWKNNVEKALHELDELENNSKDALAEDSSVYTLSEGNSFIIKNELMALYEYGLGIVFEVKQKPRFCFDALICFFLGVVQVLAGVLVCALSFGAASQIGLGLISEGVSDMISGVEGMVKGSFDWASWAISKSISIGISLLSAGFSAVRKAVGSVIKVTKSLLSGSKSFASVTADLINSGKGMFISLKGTLQSGVTSMGNQSFGDIMKRMSSSAAFQQNFKYSTNFAVKELGKQSVMAALDYSLDEGLREAFVMIFESAFKDIVSSSVKQNSALAQALGEFISSGVREAALKEDHFKIDQAYEQKVKEHIEQLNENVIHHLITDCTAEKEVISQLSNMCDAAIVILNNEKLSGVAKGVSLCLKAADHSATLIQMLANFPTKNLIDTKFVPEFLNSLKEHQQSPGVYDQDGQHNLQDVQRLKEDNLCLIAQCVSEAFIKACSGHTNTYMTSRFKGELTSVTGNTVVDVLNMHKTQTFFDDQRHMHNMKSTSHNPVMWLSEQEREELMQYTEDISKEGHPAKAFDMYVLTKSDLLNGKGIRISVIDEQGRRLSEEHYAGSSESAGDIKLRLTKTGNQMQPPDMSGEGQMYRGQFEIVQDGDQVIPVYAAYKNGLYHAIAQATGNNSEDSQRGALWLREKVKNEVQKNLELYAPMIKLQRDYDHSDRNRGRYAIPRGGKKETGAALQEYLKHIEEIRGNEYLIIRTYRLGFVGKYQSVISARKSINDQTLHTEHIPPKDSILQAQRLMSTTGNQKQCWGKNPELYKLIYSYQNDSDEGNLITMQVLDKDHSCTLMSEESKHLKMSRKLLADTATVGDAELLLKQCMILHHPLTSQRLRAGLGENTQPLHQDLSVEGTRSYYRAGYLGLVEQYRALGIIDPSQRERLIDWVTRSLHEDINTAEYREVLHVIANQN